MTTTNAKTANVPGFGKKLWNAVMGGFKRSGSCSCSAQQESAPKAAEVKTGEKRAEA